MYNQRKRSRRTPESSSVAVRIPPNPFTYHYVDNFITPRNVTTTLTYFRFNVPSQGLAANQRLADNVNYVRHEVKFTLTTANVDIFNRVRLVLFIFRENDAFISPTTQSVLSDPTLQGVLSPLSYEHRNQYTLLYDELFNLTGTASAPTINSQINRNFTIRRKSTAQMDYGTTAGIGNIYLGYLSDSALAPFPVMSFSLRSFFVI
jgi:hypothetical protein